MPSKERVQHVWTAGSYADVGSKFLSMAAHLVDAAGVGSDSQVLDVACGTGNVAITAARREAQVTGVDITPAMIEDARANAAIAGVEDIDWREGDAAALPVEDDSFDVTLSCVGHMFAEPPEDAAAELLRVTRPGGRIAFTVWPQEGVQAAMAIVLQNYLPADSDGPPAPMLWADPDVVGAWLSDEVNDLTFENGTVTWPALSPEHFWDAVRTRAGAYVVGLQAVGESERPALRAEMIETIEDAFDDRTNTVPTEYRLTTATV